MKLNLRINMPPDDLAKDIVDSCDEEEIYNLIYYLNEFICDYNFTKKLKKYIDEDLKELKRDE